MNKTPNYALNQWDAEDKVQRIDFNADNARLDAALKAQADALAGKASASALSSLQSQVNSQAATLAKKGNCKIDLFSYTGTGTFGPNTPTTIQFPQRPTGFFVLAEDTIAAVWGSIGSVHYSSSTSHLNVSWSGSNVSLTTNNGSPYWQLNAKTTYQVMALYSMS